MNRSRTVSTIDRERNTMRSIMLLVYIVVTIVAVFTNAANVPVVIEQVDFANETVCEQCVRVMDDVISTRRKGGSDEKVWDVARKYCTDEYINPHACEGILNIQMPSCIFILDNNPHLTGKRVCAIYYQNENCEDPDYKTWDLELPKELAEIYYDSSVSTTEHVAKNDNIKLLHLTDFHYDPDYLPGSNAKCSMPLCCQRDSGVPAVPEDRAGYWGDYNVCDLPWHSILNVLAQITRQHKKIDYIYYTGDIISHKLWSTTTSENSEVIRRIFGQFQKTFGDIPIYPVLGNHEAHPTNFYSPTKNISADLSVNWLFRLAAEEWSRWLPTKTRATILKGGYYTVLVKPGFRIIALNSNVCFTYNVWLMYNDVDPYDQLSWLITVLTEAEKSHEDVHIISHVPPGDIRCWKHWNRNFLQIVRRFSKTIKGQFNGHTHLDEMRLIYDDNETSVLNVAYNGASLTTFVGFNPNYRIYDVDYLKNEVTDYEQWTYNLTEANLTPNKSPNWYKLYSLKEAYGLSEVTLQQLGQLAKRMYSDKSLLKTYYRFLGRDSEPQNKKGCDEKCLDTLLCSITSVDFEKAILCGEVNAR